MKAERSPLQLLNFYLLRSNYEFIEPEGYDETPIADHLKEYPIDIDFGHNELEGDEYNIAVKIKINKKKNPLPGYSIFVEGVGIFDLNQANIGEKLKHNLVTYSSVNIVINQLRNIIALQTGYGPIGKYLLPPIDMQDLFNKKSQQAKRQKSK